MNDLELAFPEKHSDAAITALAKKHTGRPYVNALLKACSRDIDALARLLMAGHLKPNTHRVFLYYEEFSPKAEAKRHCSLLRWACMFDCDFRFELIALLLASGADPDAPEECMTDQTPREYMHECLREFCLERKTKQHQYILNLMGEPQEDYPAHWALKYAAGKGYFYGVQLLSKKCTVAQCLAAIKHNEVKYDQAKYKWDTYSFMLHYPDEDRIWFDDLRDLMGILDRIYDYLDPIANAPVAVAMGTHPRLGENSPFSKLDNDLLFHIMRYV
jgi:hypothetical protein